MKLRDKLRTRATIRETARKFSITSEQCRADMQEAIDVAWETTDPKARAKWAELFPAGMKPSVEEFMMVLSSAIQQEN